MKSCYLHILKLITLGLLLYSCSNSKNENSNKQTDFKPTELEDLLIKYKELNVTDCNELFEIGNEMLDIYIETVNKAYEGNERAKSDILDFDIFKKKFDDEAARISFQCPEKFEEWNTNSKYRIASVDDKLKEIMSNEYQEHMELDDSVLIDLDRQLNELNEDIKKILQEDIQTDNSKK